MAVNFNQIRLLIEEKIPFLQRMGIKVEEIEQNRVSLSFTQKPEHLNHLGTSHAGAIFTFGETCGGAVIGASFDLTKYILIVKEAHIKYLKPVIGSLHCEISIPAEESQRAVNEIEESGKASFLLSLYLINDKNDFVAEMNINYVLKKRKTNVVARFIRH